MNCPDCNAPLQTPAQYCPACGAPLAKDNAPKPLLSRRIAPLGIASVIVGALLLVHYCMVIFYIWKTRGIDFPLEWQEEIVFLFFISILFSPSTLMHIIAGILLIVAGCVAIKQRNPFMLWVFSMGATTISVLFFLLTLPVLYRHISRDFLFLASNFWPALSQFPAIFIPFIFTIFSLAFLVRMQKNSAQNFNLY